MPIPQQLLKAAISELSDTTLCGMVVHCAIPTDLSRAELVERLASDGGHLCSYSSHISLSDLQRVAKVFAIDSNGLSQRELDVAVWSFIVDYDKNRARDKVHQDTGIPKLSGEELLAEVRKMARPCLHLTTNPDDGPFAGVWRGPGVVPIELAQPEHWITLDCARLPPEFAPLQLTGTVSIYSDAGPNERKGEFLEGCVALDPQGVFKTSPDPLIRIGERTVRPGVECGAALYARAGSSFPSSFQVIDDPPPSVRDWLTRMGYSFETGDYYSFPAQELRDVYEDVVAKLDPSRNDESIAAVVGGWGIDIEFAYAAGVGGNYQLVFTLWEAEPWIQAIIGKKSGKFYVRELIT